MGFVASNRQCRFLSILSTRTSALESPDSASLLIATAASDAVDGPEAVPISRMRRASIALATAARKQRFAGPTFPGGRFRAATLRRNAFSSAAGARRTARGRYAILEDRAL